jgi:sulfur transfer complex TusBCD TusB component (DsrH family)
MDGANNGENKMTNETQNQFLSLAKMVARQMVSAGVDMEIVREMSEEDRVALCVNQMVVAVEKEKFFAQTYRNSEEFKAAFQDLILSSLRG